MLPNETVGSRPRRRHSSGAVCRIVQELPPDALHQLLAALNKQGKRYRKTLKVCQREFSEPAVHGFRVEARRLLSISELLGPLLGKARLEIARRAIKRNLDVFDDLRDTHVQLLSIAKLSRRFACAEAFGKYLKKRERRFCRKTRKEVKRLRTKRFSKYLDDWRKELARAFEERATNSSTEMVLQGIARSFAQAVELKTLIDPADTKTIHSTRIAFKRFRYMVETLCTFVPGSHKTLLSSLRKHQTLMGEVQDAEVLLGAFDKFARKIQPQNAAVLRAKLIGRRERLLADYLKHSDELLQFAPTPDEIAAPALSRAHSGMTASGVL